MRSGLRQCVLFAGLLASGILFAAQGEGPTILMQQASFVPATLVVAVGVRITWTNMDDIPHSVTALDGRFDSGAILPGKSFQWTPDGPGDVGYHCVFHPSMTATITVRAPDDDSRRTR